jgi:DNA polymerase III epsilon subunit-like protein
VFCRVRHDDQTGRKKIQQIYQHTQHVDISAFVTNLTGITREKCDGGVRTIDALRQFYKAYRGCDAVVAHNLSFDKQMIEIEIQRYALEFFPDMMDACFMFNDTYNELHGINVLCTGKMGRNVCNIMIPSKYPDGKPYKKMPKLSELYEFLFHTPLEGAHDANVRYRGLFEMFCGHDGPSSRPLRSALNEQEGVVVPIVWVRNHAQPKRKKRKLLLPLGNFFPPGIQSVIHDVFDHIHAARSQFVPTVFEKMTL